MDNLLKRISDLTLTLVALLGILNILPFSFSGTDILFISSMIFFILFIALITHHTGKLEEKIKEIEDNFKRLYDIKEVSKDIEKIKIKLKIK